MRIDQLEELINCCRKQHPPLGGVLPAELRLLAELYGLMIYERRNSLDCDALAPATRALLARCSGEGQA